MKRMLHLWQQDVLIHHTERRKMKGMLKLWRQVILIQHTEDRRKLLVLIIEDQQDSRIADTNQRRQAREQPFFYDMATKFNILSRTYLYNQPCGLWNEECHHGCKYIHLLSSSSSTKRNVVQMVLCLLLVATLMKD